MSVYQKFIDSAASSAKQSPTRNKRMNSQQQQQKMSSPSKGSIAMLRQQTNLHLPALINSTISSTPLMNKQQYQRLIEADYYSTSNNYQMHCSCQCQQLKQNCHHHQQQQQHLHHHQNKNKTPIDSYQHNQFNNQTQMSQVESVLDTKDPVLREWLRAMRFETELECLTSLQARTLAIDEQSAGALSVRNSQVSIQEMRLESSFILEFIDHLIEALPLMFNTISRFSVEFSELWTKLTNQTAARVNTTQMQINNQANCNFNSSQYQNGNNLTIINCTPRKSFANLKITRPLDKLAAQIRAICIECANMLCDYRENSCIQIDNAFLESSLRKLKELYGKFVEITMRIECANIVRALDYDFSQSSLNRLSSTSSLHAARPFESSSAQLPLKWALIALWQLTKNDSYICRTLTEKWQTSQANQIEPLNTTSRVAKRLDYSTKYDLNSVSSGSEHDQTSSLRSDYQKLYQICQQNNGSIDRIKQTNDENRVSSGGALSSALRNKQQPQMKQVSTIELLIDIIISQPNKHERLDMMNFIHMQAQNDRLIDVDEWDQSVSLAIYTSNQYKVAALRILNHLCVNDQAIKTILKCFSTPPPSQGQPVPENKIIRSIFECYQTSQEHIYQNETMFHASSYGAQRGRKRTFQAQQLEDEEYSDYGSRQTNSIKTSQADESIDESDDVVVKEAISLLVQLTIPFHRSSQGLDYYTLIGRFSIDSLVKYLTNILKTTSSREMIFLSLTALANISFITTEPMKHYETNRIMLELFRASKSRSRDLELRDQAVTILANAADKNLLVIVSNGGLNFLLSCLESCPNKMANYRAPTDRSRPDQISGDEGTLDGIVRMGNKPRDRRPIGSFGDQIPDALGCSCDQIERNTTDALSSRSTISGCLGRLSTADLAAMERIHQKTAVAFARMSVEPDITKMILKYGGVKQLINLCKFGQKRNHSDTVLIACIAALRKMSKVIEREIFKHYNALDLIELDLNRTLEIYGNSRSVAEAQQRMFASDV